MGGSLGGSQGNSLGGSHAGASLAASVATVQKILRTPGRFVLSPTTPGTSFPYGGTFLGFHRAAWFAPVQRTMDVVAMEFGRKIGKLVTLDDARMAAILRGYDPTAMGLVYPNAGTNGFGEGKAAAAVRTGYYVTTRAILFAPLDETAPGVYFPVGIPQFDPAARLNLALDQDVETALVIDAGCTGAGGTPAWQVNLVSEMTIP